MCKWRTFDCKNVSRHTQTARIRFFLNTCCCDYYNSDAGTTLGTIGLKFALSELVHLFVFLLDSGNVCQWVPIEDEEVGELAGFQRCVVLR